VDDDKIIQFPIPKRVDPDTLPDSVIEDYKAKMLMFFNTWQDQNDKDKELMCKSLYDASLVYITAIKNLKKLTENMGGK